MTILLPCGQILMLNSSAKQIIYGDLISIFTKFFFFFSFLFPSQRLVPDSSVRCLCMELAGGRGIVQSGLHTALNCTRPSKIKP